MSYIFKLPLPHRPPPIPQQEFILPGFRYPLQLPESGLPTDLITSSHDLELSLQTGLLGAYQVSANIGHLSPIDFATNVPHAFLWDAEQLKPELKSLLRPEQRYISQLANNRLTILESGLEGPDVCVINQQNVLRIIPRFELEWHTAAFAAQLGLITLVEASHYLHLENGDVVQYLDTEAKAQSPVLYLQDAADQIAVKPVCTFQAQGEKQSFIFTNPLSHRIATEYAGQTVMSVSILEKYNWYFMQNATPDDDSNAIWIPIQLPIIWGWSIRVQARYDGVWDIFRKKLIVPCPSLEAPRLPLWQTNIRQCRLLPEF